MSALATTEAERRDLDGVGLPDVLDTVQEFGLASRGLVAWEYGLPESAVADAWSVAVGQGLIRAVGICDETGETMFALTG
jgi:hypothetical protein